MSEQPTGTDPVTALAQGVLARRTRAVARAMRLVDDQDPAAYDLLRALHPHTGGAFVLGVTGTPGAGKSTLVDRLVAAYRQRGVEVGVVAVDPTSPFTGGAILGDRIRMQRHFEDRGVFIRSLATRGHLGGLSRSAADCIRILDAAGYGVVIVETVGVGQDELEVARLAHTTVVVMAPGLGDDIQAIKAGILEVADVFAVNKSDRDGADATVRDLQQMIALSDKLVRRAATASPGHGADFSRLTGATAQEMAEGAWVPPIVKTVASKGQGVGELVEACEAHRAFVETSEEGARRKAARAEQELLGILQYRLMAEARARLGDDLRRAIDDVVAHRTDPYSVTRALLEAVLGPKDPPPRS